MEDFITLEDLSAFMDFDDPLTIDETLGPFAISVACGVVRAFLGQIITRVDDDIVRIDGTGKDVFRLPQRPVRFVTLITEDGVELSPDNYFLRGSLVIRTDAWEFRSARGNIAATYTHGWDLPGDELSSDEAVLLIPSDLRMVALNSARRVYDGAGPEDSGSARQSETMGNYSYKLGLAISNADLVEGEKDILEKYLIRGAMAPVAR